MSTFTVYALAGLAALVGLTLGRLAWTGVAEDVRGRRRTPAFLRTGVRILFYPGSGRPTALPRHNGYHLRIVANNPQPTTHNPQPLTKRGHHA